MKEFIRVRCPVCGMMPSEENLEKGKENLAEVRIFIMRVGGKAPATPKSGFEHYEKKGRGKAPGFIEYEDVTKKEPELVQKYQDYFLKRAKQFQEGKVG